ncbi:MAG: agmatine deiminase family protein [Thermodesulfobacteriota bacterium]
MPAEYGPHAGCWMAWPCNEQVFAGRLEAARAAYARVAVAVSEFEPVVMLADPRDAAEAARRCGDGVKVLPLDLDDSWTRDTGPTFVVDGRGRVAGVDWRFNGWGGVWPDCGKDARLAEAVLEHLGMRRYQADFVLEGGAIHVDGEGTLLAVAPCLLDPKRNPGLTLAELEGLLTEYLGVTRFIWLAHGLENDETAGHVDNVACFARPGVVLLNTVSDPADGNYEGMKENAARLRGSRDARGRDLEVIGIEQPSRREGKEGRMALSHINFYLPNGGVVVPGFDDPSDGPALEAFRRVFPDRRVARVLVLDVLWGGGGIHCITQQQPAGQPARP